LRKVTKKLVVIAKDESLALKNYLSLVKDRVKRKIKELFDDPNFSSENFYSIEKKVFFNSILIQRKLRDISKTKIMIFL
jgi:hypothetical protein